MWHPINTGGYHARFLKRRRSKFNTYLLVAQVKHLVITGEPENFTGHLFVTTSISASTKFPSPLRLLRRWRKMKENSGKKYSISESARLWIRFTLCNPTAIASGVSLVCCFCGRCRQNRRAFHQEAEKICYSPLCKIFRLHKYVRPFTTWIQEKATTQIRDFSPASHVVHSFNANVERFFPNYKNCLFFLPFIGPNTSLTAPHSPREHNWAPWRVRSSAVLSSPPFHQWNC